MSLSALNNVARSASVARSIVLDRSLLSLTSQSLGSRSFSRSSPVLASKSADYAAKTAKRAKAKAKAKEAMAEAMTVSEAAAVLRAVEVGTPWSALEVAITTKFTKGQAPPRGRTSLPRDCRMKEETVLVFADGKTAQDAQAAGANIVGGAELIPDVLSGAIIPTKVLCSPALLPVITPKLARFLGPKGLMPAVKRGTVTENIASAIKQAQGTMNWKSDKLGVIRAPVARASWPIEDISQNIKAFMAAVKQGTAPSGDELSLNKRKPSSVLQVYLSSRQGPGIQLIDA